MWRIYDYPHIVLLYYRMYQIAKFYPYAGEVSRRRRISRARVSNSRRVLDGAAAIEKWSADAVGTMNEAFIPD